MAKSELRLPVVLVSHASRGFDLIHVSDYLMATQDNPPPGITIEPEIPIRVYTNGSIVETLFGYEGRREYFLRITGTCDFVPIEEPPVVVVHLGMQTTRQGVSFGRSVASCEIWTSPELTIYLTPRPEILRLYQKP